MKPAAINFTKIPRHSRVKLAALGLCVSVIVSVPLVPEFVSAQISVSQIQTGELMSQESLGDLQVGMSAEELLTQLGEPDNKGEIQLWAADGQFYHSWSYPQQGLQVTLSSPKGTDDLRIASLTIQSPSHLQTQRNIGIGDSWDSVETAYSDFIEADTTDAYDQLVAGSIYGGVIFSFRNGQVTQIFLGAAAE